MKIQFLARASTFVLLALFFCTQNSFAGNENTSGWNVNILLNNPWKFEYELPAEGSHEIIVPPAVDGSWKQCAIPDYWKRHIPVRATAGYVWFANEFLAESNPADMYVYVPGFDDDADVFINGNRIGASSGFTEDVSFNAGKYLCAGTNTLAFRLKRRNGSEWFYGPVSLASREEIPAITHMPTSVEHARKSAAWVKDAVIYELYPRSFSKNESLRSVIPAIPQLKKLGVTVLWIMPVHPIGEVNRKGPLGSPYSIEDYYKINPEYGTLEDFKDVVKAVHKARLHIIMDLVINHTSWDNPLIKEHPSWYKHDEKGNIVAPNPDWTDVAQLDYSQPGLRSYMIGMMKYWVRDIGVDGFRCDVAEMVPIDFWDEARAALDSIKPVMMLAEGSRPDMHLKAFDLTYSWNIYDVIGKIFEGGTSAKAIDSVLERESRMFPVGSLRMRFNTNHDKNAFDSPAVLKYGTAGDSLTAALVSTLPGVPLIYNGEEVCNPDSLSLFQQVPINWDVSNGYRHFYTMIDHIHTGIKEFVYGNYTKLENSEPDDVFAFKRVYRGDVAVCIFNFAKTKREGIRIDLNQPGRLNLIDPMTGKRYVSSGGKLVVNLNERGFLILVTNPSSGAMKK